MSLHLLPQVISFLPAHPSQGWRGRAPVVYRACPTLGRTWPSALPADLAARVRPRSLFPRCAAQAGVRGPLPLGATNKAQAVVGFSFSGGPSLPLSSLRTQRSVRIVTHRCCPCRHPAHLPAGPCHNADPPLGRLLAALYGPASHQPPTDQTAACTRLPHVLPLDSYCYPGARSTSGQRRLTLQPLSASLKRSQKTRGSLPQDCSRWPPATLRPYQGSGVTFVGDACRVILEGCRSSPPATPVGLESYDMPPSVRLVRATSNLGRAERLGGAGGQTWTSDLLHRLWEDALKKDREI